MKKTAAAIIVAAFAFAADALTVEEARANLNAARAAYTNALAEAGITNTPRRAKSGKRSAATAGARTTTALSKSQAAFFENRRIAVSRDTTTMPGYVITHWHRNGKPDTKGPAVVTNRLQKIVGAEQKNPIQERAEAAEAEAKPLRDLKKAAKRTAKNFDKIMKDMEKAKKKAKDADELAFYERLVEIITEAFKAEGAK